MSSYDDVADRWMRRQYFGSTERALTSQRLWADGDVLYSYGYHFELARILRDEKGNTRGVLLNGDRYSMTTTRHQSIARDVVYRHLHGLSDGSVIIPYAALRAAGINPADVEIIDVTADGQSEREEVHYELPRSAIVEWRKINGYRELFPDEQEGALDQDLAERIRNWEFQQSRSRVSLMKRPQRRTWHEYVDAASTPWARSQRNSGHAVVGHRLVCWVNASRNSEWEMTYLPDGRTEYRRVHVRHWLGESLIRARVAYPIRAKCRTCRARPVQGPAHRVWAERREIGWLRPAYERYDYALSRAVDIAPAPCQDCGGRSTWTDWRHRTAYFLSGFDHQERRSCYFFCELPKGVEPTTVDEAYEALKPDPVTLAEAMGREVRRQGDIFFTETARTKKELLARGGEHSRMGRLLGTNHAATEVIELDGVQYARGIAHHVPDGRAPDHARVRLGEGWWLVAKNTVPLAS